MRPIYLMLFLAFDSIQCRPALPTFDGANAFTFLQQQCDFGPRNPGSEGYAKTRVYLLEHFQSLADTTFVQPFTYTVPRTGETFQLHNIIARFRPEHATQLLITAHWDTRPWGDQDPDPARRNDPIIGANDGASGVAVLMELAAILSTHSPPVGVTLVLFDGEDLGQSGDSWSYAQGAQYFAKHLPVENVREAINLDMVGDASLELYIERISLQQNPQLVRSLWKLARQLELPAFRSEARYTIFDDHVPLFELADIKAVDIIDFDYPDPYRNYWHTHADIPEHCSAASLEQVGTLLIHYLYGQK
jgi:Zn-dependent M28 family amino/carboxypeptidase